MPSNSSSVHSLELGSLLSEYKIKLAIRYVLAVVMIGLGSLATTAALLSFSQEATFALYIGVPGLAALAGGLLIGYRAFVERDSRINVFQNGMVRTIAGMDKVVRWDDITAIWQSITHHKSSGITVQTTHLYTILLSNGEKLKFSDDVKNVEQLGNMIQQEVVKRLLPKAAETLKSGGTVNFGKLSVSPQGLSNSRETIPWDQVQKVSINHGYITVRKQGKLLNWSHITVAATPNVFVFLSLVDQIVGVNR